MDLAPLFSPQLLSPPPGRTNVLQHNPVMRPSCQAKRSKAPTPQRANSIQHQPHVGTAPRKLGMLLRIPGSASLLPCTGPLGLALSIAGKGPPGIKLPSSIIPSSSKSISCWQGRSLGRARRGHLKARNKPDAGVMSISRACPNSMHTVFHSLPRSVLRGREEGKGCRFSSQRGVNHCSRAP